MTSPRAISDRPNANRPLLLIAVALVSIAFGLWGTPGALATLAGASLGLLNWFTLRWLMLRIVSAEAPQKAVVSLLLVGKIGLLMALVFILINRLALDPIGVAFGLSILFIGPVVSSLLAGVTDSARSLDPSAATAAREER